MRAIIHVDMDAFYASVEQRDAPELAGKPVIVGGHPKRGVVLAASYEVRPFGVRSAMPMAHAVRLAPRAIVVPPRFSAYLEASERVFAIFERYTPEIEPLSLDEAFLDVTGSLKLFGPAQAIAARIRREIAEEVQLPASAGIASVKFVAKMASDIAKPNGQREVRAEDTIAFLSPLPVSRLWGVGPKTEERMRTLGLKTIGDVAARGAKWLDEYLGSGGVHLWELSQGIDARAVESDRAAKSIGAEDTFEHDIAIGEALHPYIHQQALRVGVRLRKHGLKTRVVQLKLKLADFQLLTRRKTLDAPTDDGQALYQEALALLERAPSGKRVRLTGVSAQDIGETGGQVELFATAKTLQSERRGKLNKALDKIAEKFGSDAIATADLLGARVEDNEDDEARRQVGAARFDRAKE
ncbi:MAG: DNA polymerase IV [Deltaproteobacteria bacterium]|nr:DNA polymerase IV [Deltaproteobacteria bacterium]